MSSQRTLSSTSARRYQRQGLQRSAVAYSIPVANHSSPKSAEAQISWKWTTTDMRGSTCKSRGADADTRPDLFPGAAWPHKHARGQRDSIQAEGRPLQHLQPMKWSTVWFPSVSPV